MSLLPRRTLLLALLLIGTACASSPLPEPQTGEMPRRRDANSLSRQELRDTHVSDSYEAVRMLRPAWLRKRGQMSATQQSDVVVYLDNVQLGGPVALRSIPVNSITRMEFLDAASATQRWGTNHVHGAILVSTM